MPHTTHAYPFEAKVGQFAAELSARCSAGPAPRSFLLTLDPRGNVTSLVFEDGTAGWHDRARELQTAGTAHLFYDPLDDGREYAWLSWHAIEQPVMERLIGLAFAAADFEPYAGAGSQAQLQARPGAFPASWSVMF